MKKLLILLLLFPSIYFAQNKRALTVEDLWKMHRVGSVELSPDGGTIAFTVTTYSMEANKGNTDIYLVNSDGSSLRPFKNSANNESEPKFTPDGKKIAYTIDDQIHLCNLDGTGDQKLTDLYTGVSGFEFSKDGSKILFVSSVYPDCATQECNKEKDEARKESKVKAKIITGLMFRHWNVWHFYKRSHLFMMDIASKKYYDLNLYSKTDVPPIDLGSANDYNFSPDGREVAFTQNQNVDVATNTNNDIFIANLSDVREGEVTPVVKISTSDGNDNQPVYSPDGKYIAYTSMRRAGFEADQQNLILYDRANHTYKNLTSSLDRSVGEFIWSPDSKNIYFTSANEIYNSIYKLNVENDEIKLILKEHVNDNLSISPDGKTIYFRQQRSRLPYEIFSMNNDGGNVKQITDMNKELLANIDWNPVETFWSEGAQGAKVQSILVKPPFFNPKKKYPMLFLIHGGPQGHWEDDFHYRWNIQLFASKGYVIVAPNPRGSVGYGQLFTDQISKDWGGKAYTDLMNAYDYALKNFDYIDSANTFAAGASYGGYMINWIEGHTDRFNALVSHDGVFNLESMYGSTEELWFPEWEFGGAPWQNRALYEKWSPHRYIQNAKTPMLIVEGANDFRVPESEAFQLFTSLQRLGVESKLLYFPDEYHFVTKPQNARLWWNTIFDWFKKHYRRDL